MRETEESTLWLKCLDKNNQDVDPSLNKLEHMRSSHLENTDIKLKSLLTIILLLKDYSVFGCSCRFGMTTPSQSQKDK